MLAMHRETRGFLTVLAASAGGAALSGAAAALVVSLSPRVGRCHAGALGVVVLPVAVALAAAGALARSAAAILLNALAFLLPQVAAALAVFFVFAQPGGAGGPGLVLTTGEFWVKVGAA